MKRQSQSSLKRDQCHSLCNTSSGLSSHREKQHIGAVHILCRVRCFAFERVLRCVRQQRKIKRCFMGSARRGLACPRFTGAFLAALRVPAWDWNLDQTQERRAHLAQRIWPMKCFGAVGSRQMTLCLEPLCRTWIARAKTIRSNIKCGVAESSDGVELWFYRFSMGVRRCVTTLSVRYVRETVCIFAAGLIGL